MKTSKMQQEKSVSGDFTFSPSRLKKKLKLEIPSARTHECESRKLSNLCETQNTISHRVNNRKKTVKSIEPTDIIALEPNFRKVKNHFRSEVVSPSRKQSISKNIKMIESHKSIQNSQIMDRLFNEPEDNLIGFTNQSSEFSKADMIASKKSQKSITTSLHNLDKNEIKHLKLKIETPILQQERGLISEIRQYEKSAKSKKQHLNYAYLKEKVLKQSSAKKIQRAWRNYKTQKLITSYSNNISLKFTSKMKNQLISRQDPEESKILTVRSCGYNGKTNEFKRQGKRNLSQLQPIENNSDFDSGSEENIPVDKNRRQSGINEKAEIKKKKQISEQSVIIKFQMEEIQRWEELIKNLRQGKKIDEVLKKSFERKEELQKQLSNSINNFRQINKKVCQPEVQQKQVKEQRKSSPIVGIEEINEEQKIRQKSAQKEEFIKRVVVGEVDKQISKFRVQKQEQITPIRKQKLQFYENEIRRIDNEETEDKDFEMAKEVSFENARLDSRGERETEQEENLKLKRKLEAINKIEFFNSIYEQKAEQTQQVAILKVNDTLHTKETSSKQRQIHDVRKNTDLSQFQLKQDQFEDRLSISRKRTNQDHKSFYYQDDELEFVQKYRAFLSVNKNKNYLVNKVEDEIMFDLLLELSEKDDFIQRIQKVYSNSPHKLENGQTENKPQGICTNLESIKDYLENFVAFSFEEMPQKLLQGFNLPRQPEIKELLDYLNKGKDYESTDFHRSVLPEELFNQHWQYAAEQIYFDVRYPDDPKKQAERVEYLKEITKIYFRVIFDGFNENLQQYRIYGREGKPFPWKSSLNKSRQPYSIAEIKPMIRLGYRRLSQLAIIYCGLLFEDKKHTMSEKMMEEIQKERLDTLIEIEMKEEEHKWSYSKIEQAETLWQVHFGLQDLLLKELCCDLQLIFLSR